MNIRQEADRAKLTASGYTWATVAPRGEIKGSVLSKHRSYAAADKAARGLDRTIVEIAEAGSF